MQINGKKILVVGMARSGVEAARLALVHGANISLYDAKLRQEISGIDDLVGRAERLIFGGEIPVVSDYQLIVLSPGVPTQLDFLVEARDKGITVIGEVAFAAGFAKGRFVGITGTNGKTTTTALTEAIFRAAGLEAIACGNIGLPVSQAVREGDCASRIYVVELSSYQLESSAGFHLTCAAILNLTPDHLARHKTMSAYLAAKLNIARGLEHSEQLLLNADSPGLEAVVKQYGKASRFSRTKSNCLVSVVDQMIVVGAISRQTVIAVDQLIIRGEHNVENALAATGIAYLMDVPIAAIAMGLSQFKGVAHRNEWVMSTRQIDVYNDSKATNPEASIPALKALDKPTVLIAGGMNKHSDYSEMLTHLHHVEHIILLGETKFDLATALEKMGYLAYTLVDDMKQAVSVAVATVSRPGCILLSPACASWDMYDNFEARGDHFKQCVALELESSCKRQL